MHEHCSNTCRHCRLGRSCYVLARCRRRVAKEAFFLFDPWRTIRPPPSQSVSSRPRAPVGTTVANGFELRQLLVVRPRPPAGARRGRHPLVGVHDARVCRLEVSYWCGRGRDERLHLVVDVFEGAALLLLLVDVRLDSEGRPDGLHDAERYQRPELLVAPAVHPGRLLLRGHPLQALQEDLGGASRRLAPRDRVHEPHAGRRARRPRGRSGRYAHPVAPEMA
mmetsp:Transcript_86771/g.246077  ORF Transcript_86771/g.246077 Transcript_86771/m.246077 type:complete len:222 (-) Transcript_86771:5-670(-)